MSPQAADHRLTAKEAIAMLPRTKRIHTFLGAFGADWTRIDVVDQIKRSAILRKSTGMAAAMGHKLAVEMPEGRWLYVQTKEQKHE